MEIGGLFFCPSLFTVCSFRPGHREGPRGEEKQGGVLFWGIPGEKNLAYPGIFFSNRLTAGKY